MSNKFIKESEFSPARRELAKRMIQGTIGVLATDRVAKSENIAGLVKAAVHRKVHDLPDGLVELGLEEPKDSQVGRVKRWVTQASVQVIKWSRM